MLAIERKHSDEVIEYLITDYKADVNDRDRCQMTPVHLAASMGRLRVLQLLLKAGAKLDVWTDEQWSESSPLHLAVLHNHIHITMFLLSYIEGTDIDMLDKSDSNHRTPLILAVKVVLWHPRSSISSSRRSFMLLSTTCKKRRGFKSYLGLTDVSSLLRCSMPGQRPRSRVLETCVTRMTVLYVHIRRSNYKTS
mmetsp:Transcript_25693/g.40627  ORF Transcript_25693/g.40627 Transcript_25693/m.40627 type:complete len:194 (+) Transcript_25693:504-1085(+)